MHSSKERVWKELARDTFPGAVVLQIVTCDCPGSELWCPWFCRHARNWSL